MTFVEALSKVYVFAEGIFEKFFLIALTATLEI